MNAHCQRPLAWITLVLVGCNEPQAVIGFSPRWPSGAEVDRMLARDQAELQGFEVDEPARRVIEQFEKCNRQMAVPRQRSPEDRDAAFTDLRGAAKRALEDRGPEGVRRIGLVLLARFERALNELIRATQGVPGAADALLHGSPPVPPIAEAFERFRAVGGGFLELAGRNALLRPGGDGGLTLDEADRFFVRLCFKVYWSQALPEVADPLRLILTDDERRWYEIWVVERSLSASLERKLGAIATLTALDAAYPAERARGIVFFQARTFDEAALAFEKALEAKPGDPELRVFLAQARKAGT